MMRVAAIGRLRGLILLSAPVFLAGCRGTSTQTYIDRATQELQIGSDQAALIDLQHAVKQAPQSAPARLLLAEAELRMGGESAANRDIDEAIRLGAPSEGAAELQARIALALGNASQLLKELASLPLAEPARDAFRGRALLQLGKYPEAELAFRIALVVTPEAAESQVGLADVLTAEGQLDEATVEVNRALAEHPDSAEAWRARGAIDGRRRDFAGVQVALEKAVNNAPGQLNQPDQASLLNALVNVRLQLGDIRGAEAAYQQIPTPVRAAPFAQILAGRIALANGDYAAAAVSLQEAVNKAPTDPVATELLGRALLAKGDLAPAADAFSAVAAGSPNYATARKLLAEIELRSGNSGRAEFTLIPLADANSADAEFDLVLSAAQVQDGHQLEAIKTLERGLQANPENVNLQLKLASVYLSTDSAAKGFERLDQLVAKNDKDLNILNRVGVLLLSHNELQRAAAMLAKASALDPHNETTEFAQAEVALRRGDKTAARQLLQAICGENPKAVRPRLTLAQLELADGREPQASQLIQEVANLSAGNAAIFDEVGHLYLHAHFYDKAIAEFRDASAIAPRDPNIWLHLSAAQLMSGQPAEALAAALKALEIAPDSTPAVNAAVVAELRANDTDAAMKRVSTARDARPNDVSLWELAGDVRMARKEFVLARASYDRANKIRPSAALALKSVQARHAGSLADEFEPLKEWISGHPSDIDALIMLASAYEVAGRPADAVRQYEAILSHTPTNRLALNNLAWLYVVSKDPRAVATARRAYDLAPNNFSIADTYGWALLQSGQAASSVKVLRQAAAGNTIGVIQVHYATALARTGDRDGARRILTQVISSNPSVSERSDAEDLLKEL